MLQPAKTYQELAANFRWRIPDRYNIGHDVVTRHADGGGRLALIHQGDGGEVRRYSFDDLERLSNRLANLLKGHGFARGDRLAVLLPQQPEAALAHVAAFKSGGISVPLFALFGTDALRFRLADSGVKALVTDAAGFAKVAPLRDQLPELELVLTVEPAGAGSIDLWAGLDRASDRFATAGTGPDDPAIIIYTSGTTGNPKGALHGHRVLLGHLPGVELPHDFFPQPGDRFWTPADWAWIGGLFDVLLPAWHHGVPVVAHRARKFDPDHALRLIADQEVRNLFMPPTALRLLRQALPEGRAPTALRTLASGGETLGPDMLEWGQAAFGLSINEFYGQTECNLVAGSSGVLFPPRPGSMGRAIPGHRLAVVDPEGNQLPVGVTGEIAVEHPDPVMFLGYWNNPEATRAKFRGNRLLTGDRSRVDADGYFWFAGRADDVITSAGYRIGPEEIEHCLLKHRAVALAAVVGVPDPVRTEIVKAYLVLRPGHAPSPELAREIQAFVRGELAAHEYPRLVEFLPELPMTATGKIIRRALREPGGKAG